MKNINATESGISFETKQKIAFANSANAYTDITPYELEIGFPSINYRGFFAQPREVIIYVAPAQTFTDKNMVVGYTGKSAGVNVRVAKGISVRTGSMGGKPIRNNVRNYNDGDLIITNKRILFVGKDDSFEYRVDKISATKIIDKTSFIIQSGRASKNIQMNAALVVYACGFINYVVGEHSRGVDIFSEIEKDKKKITQEQMDLCNIVRKEIQSIQMPKQKKKNGCLWPFIIFILGTALITVVISQLGYDQVENREKDESSNAHTISMESSTNYSALDIINMSQHPVVFDSLENTRSYYDGIGDDRIAIVSIQEHYQLQSKLKNIADDPVLIYFIQHSTKESYVGTVQINIFQEELCKNMDIDGALQIITSYLPKNFLTYYKLDRAYSYGNDETTIYTYACRLNDAGVEYHNSVAGQYSSYYNFKIVHYLNKNQWKLETDYAANGNKDIGWIEKYADKWDVDITEYFGIESK
ncbi:MAG TPA: hypothetical protein DIC60_02875 [Lachnospiraceae bacterium]|nr:hypothetical protein [Lachnospiraceae bacterium]